MDNKNLYIDISNNMNEIENVENEISMSIITIYQRTVQELKEKNLFEINDYFTSVSKSYGQKTEQFSNEIGRITRKYVECLEKIIRVYDDFFVEVFRTLQSTIENQNIAIANIITLNNKLEKGEIGAEIAQEKMMECASKKIDYEVIVKECYARMKWCISSIEKDIEQIFTIKTEKINVYKEGIFTKIKKILSKKMYGKNKFADFIDNYEKTHMKTVNSNNNAMILRVAATMKGFNKQIRNTRKQIINKRAVSA